MKKPISAAHTGRMKEKPFFKHLVVAVILCSPGLALSVKGPGIGPPPPYLPVLLLELGQ